MQPRLLGWLGCCCEICARDRWSREVKFFFLSRAGSSHGQEVQGFHGKASGTTGFHCDVMQCRDRSGIVNLFEWGCILFTALAQMTNNDNFWLHGQWIITEIAHWLGYTTYVLVG